MITASAFSTACKLMGSSTGAWNRARRTLVSGADSPSGTWGGEREELSMVPRATAKPHRCVDDA